MSTERNDERDWRWWQMYCAGRAQSWIARKEGVDQSTVSLALKKIRESLPKTTRDEEIRRSIEMLHELRAGALEIWEMAAAPMVAGKDGMAVIDPESGEFVRDHSGRLRALETALKVDARIAQLLGLDAAARVDMTVAQGEERAAELLAQEAASRLAASSDHD